jgi:sugar (pentulose or hexulose) kinase
MGVTLVFDVGTSSMRGVLFDQDHTLLRIFQISYSPEFMTNGYVEQRPGDWSEALIGISRDTVGWAAAQGLEIDAVSVTSQRSSVIPIDVEGVPLHPAIMWQDARSHDICLELGDAAPLVYERTGTRINPLFAAPKMTWIKRHLPHIYTKAHKLVTIADYVLYQLTGVLATDYTYGSRNSMMNLHTLQWEPELLRLFEIDESKLCELRPQGSILGQITPQFSLLTGLRSGIPVVSAGGDQQCAALGAGVIAEGSLQITSGTGSFMLAPTRSVRLDPNQKMICNASAVPGMYVLESSILVTSKACQWFNEQFYGSDLNGSTSPDAFQVMLHEAARSTVGAGGLMMMPHLHGRGSPDWNTLATGMFFNFNLGTSRADFARSILEGIAYEISENLNHMEALAGQLDSLLVAGGLTRSSLFNQIQSDVIGRSIAQSTQQETTAIGACISASVALGRYASYDEAIQAFGVNAGQTIYIPDRERSRYYAAGLRQRVRLYDTLNKAGIYQSFHTLQEGGGEHEAQGT